MRRNLVRLPTNKSDLLGTTIQVRRTGITVCLVFATRPSLMIGSRLKKTRSLVRWKRTTAPPPGDGAAFWVGLCADPVRDYASVSSSLPTAALAWEQKRMVAESARPDRTDLRATQTPFWTIR